MSLYAPHELAFTVRTTLNPPDRSVYTVYMRGYKSKREQRKARQFQTKLTSRRNRFSNFFGRMSLYIICSFRCTLFTDSLMVLRRNG